MASRIRRLIRPLATLASTFAASYSPMAQINPEIQYEEVSVKQKDNFFVPIVSRMSNIDDVIEFIFNNPATPLFILMGESHTANPYLPEAVRSKSLFTNIGVQMALLEIIKMASEARPVVLYNEAPHNMQKLLLTNKSVTAYYAYQKAKEKGIPFHFSKVSHVCRQAEGQCDNRYGAEIAALGKDNTVVIASLGLLHVTNVADEIRSIIPDAKILIINTTSEEETRFVINQVSRAKNAADLSAHPPFKLPKAVEIGKSAMVQYYETPINTSSMPNYDELANMMKYMSSAPASGAGGGGGGAAAKTFNPVWIAPPRPPASAAAGGGGAAAETFKPVWVKRPAPYNDWVIKCPICGIISGSDHLSLLHAYNCLNKGKIPDLSERPSEGGKRRRSRRTRKRLSRRSRK